MASPPATAQTLAETRTQAMHPRRGAQLLAGSVERVAAPAPEPEPEPEPAWSAAMPPRTPASSTSARKRAGGGPWRGAGWCAVRATLAASHRSHRSGRQHPASQTARLTGRHKGSDFGTDRMCAISWPASEWRTLALASTTATNTKLDADRDDSSSSRDGHASTSLLTAPSATIHPQAAAKRASGEPAASASPTPRHRSTGTVGIDVSSSTSLPSLPTSWPAPASPWSA